jgi:tRNA A-37 threonylcarbamoyl transferase component Bud32
VQLPGFANAFYLKRQHTVGWRERLRNRFAGFGWITRCEREASILKQLAAAGLPCPQWVAFGRDEHGRAFLLVEETANARDIRLVANDTTLSLIQRRQLAVQLGRTAALLHASGFTTPDLSAKHVLISEATGEVTLVDWQSAQRKHCVSIAERLRCLAALHASVADELASPRERLRVLRAALTPMRQASPGKWRFSDLARQVLAEADALRQRRSIRDQRQPVVTPSAQRLVWVAGEAVCAVPDIAAHWPKDAIAAPFYGCEPGTLPVKLPDDRDALLIRGRSFAPFGRFDAWLRCRPWRSSGVTLGRVLFHLERYGIPAPRLLAFGQRITSRTTAEWFALHTPTAEPLPTELAPETAELLGRLLRQLHNSGCLLGGEARQAFGCDEHGVCIRDVTAVRLARATQRDRQRDLARLLVAIQPAYWEATEAGYRSEDHADRSPKTNRMSAIPSSVRQ